ncbi:MAG: tRNA 5-methylaminomethyl-2-thiouridine biosynthesis bifunctional protein [Campylobacterota bacterium]|nr:tRNA 5-methylaminomethyl-2-thiouridine biosynthesis bifunctional protein [Campylobacterota bacterium]
MKKYDYLIIGAGSAGCNIAYYLKQCGKKVAIVDKEGIAKGASGAAGAFLSPLPGKKNPYNTLVNSALAFSLDFYEKLIPQAIQKKGVLRVANDNFDKEKLQTNSDASFYDNKKLKNISLNFKYDIDGFFYENAAVLTPKEVCEKLLNGCDFYIKDVQELIFKNGFYIIDDLISTNIILTQGTIKPLVPMPYIDISPIYGVKIDVKTTTKVPFNIHKSISISTNKNDGTVAIGATKQRHDMQNMQCLTTCDKCAFYVNSDEMQIKELLTSANELIELENLEVVNIYKGARATIKSYFPTIGRVVNFDESLKKYPSIKNGTKIPPNLLEYFPNLYIINALGSRGFVLAPYLAKMLGEHILNAAPIPQEISTQKLFYKAARKS